MLKTIFSILTRTQRYYPNIEWRSKSFVYNSFRLFEYIFGRKYGIRAEMSVSAYQQDGITYAVYQFHTWEALFVNLEHKLRSLTKIELPVKVWVPQLATSQGLPNLNAGYVFAIAYSNTSGSQGTSGTSVTFTGTVSGSDTFGVVAASVAESANSNLITGVTWNGSSMTFRDSQGDAFNDFITLYYLAGISTGNVVISRSTSGRVEGGSTSYSGVDQTTPIDVGGKQATTSSTITQTLTTTVDQCWMNGCMMVHRGQTMGANTTERVGAGINTYMVDSNGARSTGSNSLVTTQSDSTGAAQVYIAFKPVGSGPVGQNNVSFLLQYIAHQ